MKELHIPYLADLDDLPPPQADTAIEATATRQAIDQVNWPTFPHKPDAGFFAVRSDTSLYLRFHVSGLSLRATHLNDGEPVYTDSCVEFFMRKEGDGVYRNFEFNCLGICDASLRLSRTQKLRSFSPADYATIRRYSSLTTHPTLPIDEQEGLFAWQLTVAIPFVLMGLDDTQRLPSTIWGNFYKCADSTPFPHYLTWNPVDTAAPDFHHPPSFAPLHLL
ncbi:MAG: hypothetical protein LBT73_01500 [Tannerellaceae bacterium]|jgi:hypothetical protein|nr:hypothetical protein [Tannerellaceae bacterium]